MKDFFSSIFFKAVLAVFAVLLGALVYTFSFSGNTSPITSITGTILTPLQSTFSNVTIFLSNIYSKSFEFDEIVAENESLKEQINELEQQARQYNYALSENIYLKEMMDISEVNETYVMEICEVVGKDFSNTSSILTLDKGSNVGIEIGDCVITSDGLVGYISKIGINFSQVTTVLDPSFTIGALVSRSREIGIIEGDLSLLSEEMFKFAYLDKNADINTFDIIETSGITGSAPKGIAIGFVSDIITEINGISKYTIIKPLVDIENLNQVFIIKDF